jgi:hypothetical protein
MDVREILEQVNERLLLRLIEENRWPLAQKEGASIDIEKIAAYITASDTAMRVWESLSAEEKEMLLYFLFRVGSDVFTYRQMEEYAKEASPIIAYSGLTGLRRRGLVYTLRRLWGELAYCLPDDLQETFRLSIISDNLPNNNLTDEPVNDWHTIHPPISHILFRLLQLHRKQPILLTKKGVLTAKTRRLWESMIPYPAEIFLPFAPEAAGKEEAREQFFVDLLLSMRLIRKQLTDNGMQYVIDEAQAAKLFCGQEALVQHHIYQKVKERISLLHPCYGAIWNWLEVCGERTFSLRVLREVESTLLKGMVAVEKDDHWYVFAEEVVPLLTLFGFTLQNGEGEAAVCSWMPGLLSAKYEQSEERYTGIGYIQPTFEIMLLPYAPYEIRWQLGAYTQLEEQQEVWTFRLTKTSVQAVEDEQESMDLFELLERIQSDVPLNVREQLTQWFHGGSYVSMERVIVLQCYDMDTAEWLAADKELSGYLRERLGERTFLIEETNKDKLESVLAHRNIRIRDHHTAKLQEKEIDGQIEAMTPFTQSGYKVESVFPTLEDALPELKEVPAIWCKNFQRYHHSTLRQLVKVAQTLGIPLSVEINEKPAQRACVLDIRTENGHCYLTLDAHGKKESVLLEEIGRIKLDYPVLSNRG